MYPHRIRLSAAWRSESGRVDLPTDGRGAARLVRSFGLPRRIDDYEHVWLACETRGSVRWSFNGEPLGDGSLDVDVTARLRMRNEWVAECDGDWSLGDAALVIRCSAYLRDVRLANGQVSGEVAGTAKGPLELYVMVDDAQSGYRMIVAGESFAFPVENGAVRVELVNVSQVWDVVELPLSFRET